MENTALKEPPMMELIEGKVVMMSPRPLTSHNMVLTHISHIFEDYLWDKPCIPFSDGVDVYLDEKNHYIPDVMIVCNRDIIKPEGIYGAPDLVVEVLSPSTAKNDRGPKMRHYAAAGVKEYWIVSPLSRSVEVYLQHDGHFELDDIYTDYPDWELARMTDEERAEVKKQIKVSLYNDLYVNVADVFHKLL